ncbi:MAG: hypothetical protein IT487_01860 [Chromatiaceae bacterium]|nr:hypothetical protein [Chromatiaceae bacterium]
MSNRPVMRFFLKVLAWLPVTFGIWYYMALVATWPVTWLVNGILTSLFSEIIIGVHQVGYHLEVAVNYVSQTPQAGLPRGAAGELVFQVNPLMYGYCLPLYTALILASPSAEGQKWFRWLVGLLILQLVEVWGVSFHILKTLLFNTGPEVSAQLAMGPWGSNAIALGYQFGYLILPAVAPLVIWIAFHGDYLRQLAPGIGKRLQ